MRGSYQQIADCARGKSYVMMLFIVDDMGYKQQSRQQMQVLFTLMADRYERGSVMISSNLPLFRWKQIFKDPMATVAAIDRLVHHSVIVALNIES
ncbi:MAG: ATP-binding protein [Desulfobacteraceae bacterium]|jgi:DNA replication protein DnaC|nr:ATP-binding protein [Desulfobacteraceae bacterium]